MRTAGPGARKARATVCRIMLRSKQIYAESVHSTSQDSNEARQPASYISTSLPAARGRKGYVEESAHRNRCVRIHLREPFSIEITPHVYRMPSIMKNA